MSFPDGQKIPADGLFMFGMCTVTVTSFLLSGFHPEQNICLPILRSEKQMCSFHIRRSDTGGFGRKVSSVTIKFNQVNFHHNSNVLPLKKPKHFE